MTWRNRHAWPHGVQGVRERFAAHRGNVLISMDDFKTCTIEKVEKKEKTALRFRDHGHEENIKKSYEMPEGGAGCAIDYVWETGELFLATKKALDSKTQITINGFDRKRFI
jgi:hypothetical protein